MLRTIDLFSGCGGLTEGFLSDRFDIVAHVEWDRKAVTVLNNRLRQLNPDHSDDVVIRFDIERTDELINGFDADEEFGSHVGLADLASNKQIDLVIGGPPCQAYSIAGRIRDENGMRDDYRNYLFESFVEILRIFRPRAFVFENVEGMLSSTPDGSPIVDRIRDSFTKAGYKTIADYRNAVFDLSEYGVPQQRKRVIILGLLEGEFEDPGLVLSKFYSKDPNECFIRKQDRMTARDAIGDLPALIPKDKPSKNVSHTHSKNGLTSHEPRFHNQRDIETFRMMTEDVRDGTGLYSSIDAIKELYTKRTGKKAEVHKYNVILPEEPSNTIVAHLKKDGLRHIHWDPEQARSITVREAACLQGFPRDFEFPVNQGAAYEMIGNAVPPPFAALIANAIVEVFNSHHIDN